MTVFKAIGLIVFLYALTILMPSVFEALEESIVAVLHLVESLAKDAENIEMTSLGSTAMQMAPTVIMTPGLQ
jgi:hypothetical protein